MASVDKRFLDELKKAGRQAPVKFWRHVRSQTGRPREDPLIKEDRTRIELDPGETIQFVEGRDLQALMPECVRMGVALGLGFSTRKSALIGFGGGVELKTDDLTIQVQEDKLQAKSRSRGIAAAKALWGHNRYKVIRTVWKMVAVLGLAFENGVLRHSSRTRECLEVRQGEVERAALGTNRGTPYETVQGDMGWASFDAREARAKLGFERCLSRMREGY
ncbi:hypothetical protein HPB47_000269 [Ixodes persulcatus]|uniref:Uncharacterized protein n=1 Tax=Ixodes persulcatus TaxID=34615 RepID=A0AC60PSE1_IXOPE|nr:hypothetical protein HPB47_000269 [Ixodes persulcatus]